MKRILLLVLSALLLLSSCQQSTLQTQKNIDKNTFYLDTLPEIGSFSGKADGGRFYEDVTYDFIPSDEYGEIVPFIGSYRVFETQKSEDSAWHAEMGYCTYGFCTPDGKIVMDASDKNAYVFYRETDDGFGYYTLRREVRQKDDAPDEYVPEEVCIIPRDGSWCLELDSSGWVTNAGGGYISVCDYSDDGKVKTFLYDYDGKLVRTIDGTDSAGVYSHGLMLVSQWVKGGYSAEFINENGEKVLGPYSAASDFNEFGITAVKDEKGAYLVRYDGEILTDYYESFFKEFSNDMKKRVFAGRHMNNHKMVDVFSADGKFLGTATGSNYVSFRFPDNGKILYYYTMFDNDENGNTVYNSEKMIYKTLGDDENFVSSEFGVCPNSYSGTDNCFIHVDKEKKQGFVFDGNGETIAVLDGVSDVVNTSEKGEYIIYVEGEYDYSFNEETGKPNEDTRKTHVYDSKKKQIIHTMDSTSNVRFVDNEKRFIMISDYDLAEVMFAGLERCSLYDTVSEKMLFEDCSHISINQIGEKMYINVCTDNSAALYDEQMKLIRKTYFE